MTKANENMAEEIAQGWRFKLEQEQALLSAGLTAVRTDISELGQSVRELTNLFQQKAKTPWALIIAAGTFLFALMSSVVVVANMFVNQNMQVQLSPISGAVNRMVENQLNHDNQIRDIIGTMHHDEDGAIASSIADAQSKSDRAQLNERVKTIEQRMADGRSDRMAHEAALAERGVEVETQFRAEDRIRNIQFAEQQRMNAILWNRLFPHETYPSVAYFPEMAQSELAPLPMSK